MKFSELKKQIEGSGRQYDLALIERAHKLAKKSHEGQKRESGEPYITHPVAVASLLVDLGLDTESICAALLHDVVEDTGVDLETIRHDFGEDIAELVDGVTKLGRIPFSSVEEQQAENLRKLLFAMSKDIRVMIIKLCDRLHNMRTIDAKPEMKRRATAYETMEVYAPIAHRLGMSNIKEELEDLSLAELDPIGYGEVSQLLRMRGKGLGFIDSVARDIKERLAQNGIKEVEITSRIKSVYSTYRKLFVQNRSLEEIYDIYALRVIVNTVAECYNALGVLHDMYRPIPNRFKDYISTPKANMYRSLHTTVIGRDAIPFEVQIRTRDMHNNAEYGVAAHWKYKVGISGRDKLEERLAWVRQLLESQKESEDSVDLLLSLKSDLLPEEVYVFTPKGDVIELPAGATVIDFAYAIHSAVGNRMTGAKINGRIVPISYVVKTGEICDIITGARDKGPSRDWLNIVKTGEARSKIRAWFKREKREENIAEGKQLFEKELRHNLISIPPEKYEDFINDLVRRQRLNTAEEMFASIGYGGLLMSRLMPKIREEYQKLQKAAEPAQPETVEVQTAPRKAVEGVIVEGLDNCLVKFARCCNPLPGDDIVGFITRGHGVSIHKRGCTNVEAARRLGEEALRWVKVSWADNVRDDFKAALEIYCLDRNGLIADISSQLTALHVPIYTFTVNVRGEHCHINTTIGINSKEHLSSVTQRLKKIKDVETIRQTNS
ncbi:MAG: bifunctional (p)ppGpp synthetase/guanosine-3',5'-bis(diphosphate) 3'-pyrophosphohydrolase [Oscillospiraceae bacterium]|nr:bifunctional (p)ppGpp synthetase/guanosine-3',5'-bis(diphosphate) 3'-pyrophosphohydrolase [Oscillospiraceae bacterium]